MDRNEKFEGVIATKEVALRKESVDRNMIYLLTASAFLMSLSARRAWIEIMALDQYLNEQEGRSPQGERG